MKGYLINKIKYNLTIARKETIEVFGLENTNKKYKFYYDETNNIRKFRFVDNGKFNIPLKEITKNFVLGGIVCTNNSSYNIETLLEKLSLDKSIKEIKFKHIAKGNFLDCMKSKKLDVFLNWLVENKLLIHYSSLDIFYWSIVDIIDSLNMEEINSEFYFNNINEIKTIVYELIKIDLEAFISILHRYQYPNIKNAQVSDFIDEVLKFVKVNSNLLYARLYDINKDIIKMYLIFFENALKFSKNKELSFISDNKDYELIDNFSLFYLRPIGLFINSTHVFDEELHIQEILNEYVLCDGDKEVTHYSFQKSDNNYFIQFSDIIVGLIGKYYDYINNATLKEIDNNDEHLSEYQRKNLGVFLGLIHDSDTKSKAFIHNISSLTNINKNVILLTKYNK